MTDEENSKLLTDDGSVSTDVKTPETDLTWRYTVHVKKFNTTAVALDVRFRNLDAVVDLESFLHSKIQEIIETVVPNTNDNLIVGVEITHPGLSESILHHFTRRNLLNASDIMDLVDSVVQSNEKFTLDDTITWRFVTVELPGGQGRFKRRVDLADWLKSKTGRNGTVIKMPENDVLCLPRAIVTGKGWSYMITWTTVCYIDINYVC